MSTFLKIKKMTKMIEWTIVCNIIVLMLLSGCQGSSQRFTQPPSKLPTHLPPSDPIKLKMERKLAAEQIQVIQQGQYVLISIPAVLLFAEQSPNILLDSYGYLNDVACYLKMFRHVEIDVNVYDDCGENHQRLLSLTRLRASRVADYLNTQAIDSRILFTRGMGNDKPIMKTDRLESHLANSRVEILFKEEII
jgi:intracellular multiplication protein IcmN